VVMNCLTNPAFAMLPLAVTNHFSEGAWLLSGLNAANGAGLLVGGLSLGLWGGIKNRVTMVLFSILAMNLFLIGFGFTPAGLPVLAIGLLFLNGVFNTIMNATFFAILQSKVPPQVQARIFTIITSLAKALVPLTIALAAFLVDKVGVMFFFKLAGFLGIIAGIVTYLYPPSRNFESIPSPPLTSFTTQVENAAAGKTSR
jgi:MFS transporter, DHA3 family, macrolide efflux protein